MNDQLGELAVYSDDEHSTYARSLINIVNSYRSCVVLSSKFTAIIFPKEVGFAHE